MARTQPPKHLKSVISNFNFYTVMTCQANELIYLFDLLMYLFDFMRAIIMLILILTYNHYELRMMITFFRVRNNTKQISTRPELNSAFQGC